VFGTYLHGPVLARNIALADLLLGWAMSTSEGPAVLDPLDDEVEAALRNERLGAVEEPATNRFFRRLAGHRS
jgi:CobQ-like glutamine amidotransferase family enzyme